jgi:PAS domain S-box-containing protein
VFLDSQISVLTMSNKDHAYEKPLDYTLVRRRLVFSFMFAVACVTCLVLFLNGRLSTSIEKNVDIAEMINNAGRQRMLSQILAKNVLLYQKSADPNLLGRIDSIRQVIETNYCNLKSSNLDLGKYGLSEQIASYFNKVEQFQQPILQATAQLITSSDIDSIDYYVDLILLNEQKFLPIMEEFTSKYTLIGALIIRESKDVIKRQSYINISAGILATLIVLIFTLFIIKGYSDRLQRSKVALNEVLKREQQKVAKLEFITSAINVGIWEKNMSDKSENWSDVLYRILGYSAGEFKGNSAEFLSRVHPDDLDQLNDASQFSIETGMPSTMELRVKTKSGDFKWLEATGNAKRASNGKLELLIGGVIDVHEKKLLDIKLNAFVDNAPAAIAMFDRDMSFMFVSQRWIEDYHSQWQQLLGHNFYETYAENARIWRNIHTDCLTDGIVSSGKEDPITLKDGVVIWVKWEVRPWYISKSEIGGLLMFTNDVTANRAKRMELSKARQDAEAASKAKELFLTTMSHEIRTPITAINGLTQILINEHPRADQAEHLKLLKFSGDSLLSLINDILDLSKIDSGKMLIVKNSFDLDYLLYNIKNSLKFRAEEKGINLNLNYDKKLTKIFIGDANRISQIIFNLVGNSIKFTSKGSVTIDVKLLSKDKNKTKFYVSVTDTGIGIAKNKMDVIFQPFEQADSGINRNYGGSGMGLYITKKILSLMNSEIQLESEPNRGSKFFFELTLENGTMDLSNETKDFDWKAHFDLNNYRILIAEDSESNQYLMANYLNKVKIQFDFAENGLEAIKLIQSKSYNLVFMDLQMPAMDGITATKRIRNLQGAYYQHIPIIALTANAYSNIVDLTAEAGMNDYLGKPFKPSDIYQAISKYAYYKQ